jgi:hypothetical protein
MGAKHQSWDRPQKRFVESGFVTKANTRSREIEKLVIAGRGTPVITKQFPQVPRGEIGNIVCDIKSRREEAIRNANQGARVALVPVSEIRRLHKDRGCTITQIGALLTVPYRDVIAALEAP